MKRITISILFSACVLFVACGGRSASNSDNDVNPRDTVKVPEGYTGEDSIAYIENAVLKSNITAEDLLGLADVHSVEDMLYKQKGRTVTAKEWEKWIADNSVPEDLDMLEKNDTRIPSDSIVTDRVNTLKTTFARWLKARQDLAAALPKEQGDSYDYLTADMHSRMTGKLEAIIPYDYY